MTTNESFTSDQSSSYPTPDSNGSTSPVPSSPESARSSDPLSSGANQAPTPVREQDAPRVIKARRVDFVNPDQTIASGDGTLTVPEGITPDVASQAYLDGATAKPEQAAPTDFNQLVSKYSKEVAGNPKNEQFAAIQAETTAQFPELTYHQLGTVIAPEYVESIRNLYGDTEATPQRILSALKYLGVIDPSGQVVPATTPTERATATTEQVQQVIAQGKQVVAQAWKVNESEYRQRMQAVQEFFKKLSPAEQKRLDNAEGAMEIWNHLQSQQRPNVPTFQRSSNPTVGVPSQGKTYKLSEINQLPATERRRQDGAILKAFSEGRVIDDTKTNSTYKVTAMSNQGNLRGY